MSFIPLASQTYSCRGTLGVGGLVSETMTTDDMDLRFRELRVYMRFSDSPTFATLVTPSAGTVTITACDEFGNYDTIVGGTAMSISTAAYTKLVANGKIKNLKVVPTGIVGATYYDVQAVRD